MPSEVAAHMEYIQTLFLRVKDYMQHKPDLEDLIAFLDSEPPAFRSVAYESASMEIGLSDFSNGTHLHEWKKFYSRAGHIHSFHLDIGLGWAYAKTETFPSSDWEPLHPLMRWMIFDGMGYYNGLFRGRRTVKNHVVPEGITGPDVQGYDQGIGRRLWYMAKGEVDQVRQLIQSFPVSRHPDLWRGVGIACGYVGGSTQADLELLSMASGEWKKQVCTGIALASISRRTSKCETHDIAMACRMLCDKTLEEIANFKTMLTEPSDPGATYGNGHWIVQLEAGFA